MSETIDYALMKKEVSDYIFNNPQPLIDFYQKIEQRNEEIIAEVIELFYSRKYKGLSTFKLKKTPDDTPLVDSGLIFYNKNESYLLRKYAVNQDRDSKPKNYHLVPSWFQLIKYEEKSIFELETNYEPQGRRSTNLVVPNSKRPKYFKFKPYNIKTINDIKSFTEDNFKNQAPYIPTYRGAQLVLHLVDKLLNSSLDNKYKYWIDVESEIIGEEIELFQTYQTLIVEDQTISVNEENLKHPKYTRENTIPERLNGMANSAHVGWLAVNGDVVLSPFSYNKQSIVHHLMLKDNTIYFK